jgi:hypothetical protein
MSNENVGPKNSPQPPPLPRVTPPPLPVVPTPPPLPKSSASPSPAVVTWGVLTSAARMVWCRVHAVPFYIRFVVGISALALLVLASLFVAASWSRCTAVPHIPAGSLGATILPPTPEQVAAQREAEAKVREWQAKEAARVRELQARAAEEKVNAAGEKARERGQRREDTEKLLRELTDAGILKKTAAPDFWVDPTLWLMLNRDQKETLVKGLQGCSAVVSGNSSVRVLSYSNDALLADTSWTGEVRIQR